MSESGSETLGYVFIAGIILLANYLLLVVDREVVTHHWAIRGAGIGMNFVGVVAGGWWAASWGTLSRGMGWLVVGMEVALTAWARRRRPYVRVPRERFGDLFDPTFYDNAWVTYSVTPKTELRRWYQDMHGVGVDNIMEIRPYFSKAQSRDVYVFFKTWDDAFHFKMRWL